MKSPYPEEFNRQAIGLTASLHFAPTQKAADALLKEGKDPEQIFVTGNTGIDALYYTVRNDFYHSETEWAKGSRLIAVTAHRRENLGEPMRDMFRAIRRIVEEFTDVKVIYPVHLNPQVRKIADEEFGGCDRIHLIEPLDVVEFHNLMKASYLIMTDSGGIQEEACEQPHDVRQRFAGHEYAAERIAEIRHVRHRRRPHAGRVPVLPEVFCAGSDDRRSQGLREQPVL